ncbi:hypothetical protein B4U79_12508 [Dinothrombium tinctorium]|uniref:Uncharacterized protein n=1 Tax=Dinothrombium tinctorium TaxID=1965070 RepID=A0A3S3P3A3_9ACAR|nr:hypothetical protein B4U79_12508 [Dinothrombium tinctorium]
MNAAKDSVKVEHSPSTGFFTWRIQLTRVICAFALSPNATN